MTKPIIRLGKNETIVMEVVGPGGEKMGKYVDDGKEIEARVVLTEVVTL